MDGEELATPSSSSTPSHAVGESCKAKRERTAAERKARNSSKRKSQKKRLKSAEQLVPALSIGVRTAEEQNIALSAALRERDLRIELLTRRLEVAAGQRDAAKQEKSEAEQKARDTETALLISEARSLALKGELVTATDKIRSLDNDVAQLNFALAIANASAASNAAIGLQILSVAVDAVTLADEAVHSPAAEFPSSPTLSLSLRGDSPGSFERSSPPDVQPFSPSPPLGFLDP